MMALGRLKAYCKKNEASLTIGFAVAAIVFVAYIVTYVIIWNTANVSYGLAFAALAFLLYFLVRRLLGYIVTKKQGAIREHK